jgi:RNA polymerase sigma factor (sigma-70 family)
LQPFTECSRFEEVALPHLDAAYNLARWLTRDDHDAQDVVQEAYLRALKYFASYHGGDARTWLLTVVRHTCWTWLRAHRPAAAHAPFDEEAHGEGPADLNPETAFFRGADRQLVREAIEALPPEFREAVVLRDLEGLSYQEIATVAAVPLGTVMSRLARGRKHLQRLLAPHVDKES